MKRSVVVVMDKTRIVSVMLIVAGAMLTIVAEAGVRYLGASTVEMENPHDLKLSADGNLLFVSDVGYNRILVLDPNTLEYRGEFGGDHQRGTHDIDFDEDGLAYVADTQNNRVTIYEMDGAEGKLIGELNEGIQGPEGVLAHPNGRIYVGAAWSGNVVAYENGKIVSELKGLSSPHDVELAPANNIWLSDSGNNRMLLLSPELKILKELSGEPYNFDGVRYQDVLDDGTIIAADKNSHSVKIIGADGSVQQVLGTGMPAKGPGVFVTPEGIEVLDNILWISDSGNDRIVKYRLD